MRKAVTGFLLLLLAPLLSGCWDALPLEQRSVVLGIGVDLLEDVPEGEPPYEFTMVTPLVDEDRSYPSQVRSVKAHNLGEAIAIIHHTSGRTLFLGKKAFILFGRQAAEAGVAVHINQLYAFPEVRVSSHVLVADGKAKDVLLSVPPNGQRVAVQIMRIINRASRLRDSPPTTLAEFTSQIVTAGYDGISSMFTPIGSLDPRPPETRGGSGGGGPDPVGGSSGGGGSGGGGGGGSEQQYLQIGKMALWQSDRMVGEISLLDLHYLTMAKGTAHGLLVQLLLPPDERFAAETSRMIVLLHDVSPAWKIVLVDGKPRIELKVGVFLSVENYTGEVLITDPENASKLQSLMEQTIAQNITSILQKVSEVGCDAIALGQRVRIKYPEQWDAERWPAMLANASFSVEANVRIRNMGTELVGLKSKATAP